MKKALLFLLIISSLPSNAQVLIDSLKTRPTAQDLSVKKDTANFIAYWAKGDKYNYRVTKKREMIKENKIENSFTDSYEFTFHVIDSTATSYKIAWEFPDKQQIIHQPIGDIEITIDLNDLKKIVYTTDEYGEVSKIDNLEQIQKVIKTELDKLSFKKKLNLRRTLGKNYKEIIEKSYLHENSIIRFFQELTYFHYPMGIQLTEGEKINYEEELELPIDPRYSVKRDYEVNIDEIIPEEFYAHFSFTKQIDKASVIDVLSSIFTKMEINEDDKKTIIENLEYKVDEETEFDYYYDPGIPIKITINQMQKIDFPGMQLTKMERIKIQWID